MKTVKCIPGILVLVSVFCLVATGCATALSALGQASSIASSLGTALGAVADTAGALGVDANAVAALGTAADRASSLGAATGSAAALGSATDVASALGAAADTASALGATAGSATLGAAADVASSLSSAVGAASALGSATDIVSTLGGIADVASAIGGVAGATSSLGSAIGSSSATAPGANGPSAYLGSGSGYQPVQTPTPAQTFTPAQSGPRLGILPFTGGSISDGETLAVLFSIQDDLRSAFTIVPRTNEVNAIIEQREYQTSTQIDSDTIARLGRMLNVNYLISGHIRRMGDRNLFITAIVNVETYELVAGDYRQYNSIEEIPSILPSIARNMAAAVRRDSSRLPALAITPIILSERGAAAEYAEALAQILPIAIANTGRYTVLPRTSTVQTALNQLQSRTPNFTIEDKARAVGTAINAAYVLSAEARSIGNMNMFIVQILNTDNGSQLVGESLNYIVIEDGIALMPQLATVLTGRGATAVAAFSPQSAPQPVTTPVPAPVATNPLAPTLPAQSGSAQYVADKDAWKNKWVYLGGGLGGGVSTYNYYSWGYYEETTPVFVLGFIADFALLPFLSLEMNLALGIGEVLIPVLPIFVKLGGRIAQIELSLDAGYTIGLGFNIGGTFGVHAGPGILFAKFYSVPYASPPEGIYADSAMMGFAGYKVGLGSKK